MHLVILAFFLKIGTATSLTKTLGADVDGVIHIRLRNLLRIPHYAIVGSDNPTVTFYKGAVIELTPTNCKRIEHV